MVSVHVHRLPIAAALSAALVLSACGGHSNNAAPRVTPIPAQTTSGGSTFSLDVSKFVSDRENSTLTYEVVSGGGSFTTSTYSNTFPTLGEHTVTVKITDAAAKVVQTSFVVKVTQSSVVVLQAGTNLVAMDEGTAGLAGHTTVNTVSGYTDSFLELSSSQGLTDTFQAALKRGCIVYQRQAGSAQKDLFCYDPFSKKTTQLGSDVSKQTNEVYFGKTSNDQVVFQSGSTTDTGLHLFNAVTGFTRLISDQQNELDGNAKVAADDRVYYERGVNGQSDIYVYDVNADSSTLVSANVKAETIQATLPNSGVVYTRLGASNETDLYYWKSGEVEIGADLGATAQGQSRAYVGVLSDSRVLFTLRVGVGDDDLYVWDPTSATSTLVNASYGAFHAVMSNDTVVFSRTVGGLGTEVSFWTPGNGATTDIGSSAADESFAAVTSKNDIVIKREDGSGDGLFMHDTSAATLRTLGATGSGDFSFAAVLSNGDVVYSHPTSGLALWDESGAVSANVGDNSYAYGGPVGTDGKFVAIRTVSAQDDVYFYNGGGLVAVSTDAADEGFLRGMSSDRVLFRRKASSTYDVFSWDPATPTTVNRLSNTTVNHTAVTGFTATVN